MVLYYKWTDGLDWDGSLVWESLTVVISFIGESEWALYEWFKGKRALSLMPLLSNGGNLLCSTSRGRNWPALHSLTKTDEFCHLHLTKMYPFWWGNAFHSEQFILLIFHTGRQPGLPKFVMGEFRFTIFKTTSENVIVCQKLIPRS